MNAPDVPRELAWLAERRRAWPEVRTWLCFPSDRTRSAAERVRARPIPALRAASRAFFGARLGSVILHGPGVMISVMAEPLLGPLSAHPALVKLLEDAARQGAALLVVAPEASEQVKETFVVNFTKGVVRAVLGRAEPTDLPRVAAALGTLPLPAAHPAPVRLPEGELLLGAEGAAVINSSDGEQAAVVWAGGASDVDVWAAWRELTRALG